MIPFWFVMCLRVLLAADTYMNDMQNAKGGQQAEDV
jgi:hypothetical protein